MDPNAARIGAAPNATAEYLDQSAAALRLRLYGDVLPSPLVVLNSRSTKVGDLSIRAAVLSASHLVEIDWASRSGDRCGRTSEILACGDLEGGDLLYDRAAFDSANQDEPVDVDLAWEANAPAGEKSSERVVQIGYHSRVEVLGWRKAEPVISVLRARLADETSAVGISYLFPEPSLSSEVVCLAEGERSIAAETLLCVSASCESERATVEIESLHGYPNEARFVLSRSRFVLDAMGALHG